jgi:hypothetical protein
MDKDDRINQMRPAEWLKPLAAHRTVYQPVLRDFIPEDWRVFDFPDPELVTGRRSVTTVPTQSLHLMNSPFVVEHSRRTAARLLAPGSEPAALVRRAYVAILARPPSDLEQQEAAEFLQTFPADPSAPSAGLAALCQTLFASAEFRYLP